MHAEKAERARCSTVSISCLLKSTPSPRSAPAHALTNLQPQENRQERSGRAKQTVKKTAYLHVVSLHAEDRKLGTLATIKAGWLAKSRCKEMCRRSQEISSNFPEGHLHKNPHESLLAMAFKPVGAEPVCERSCALGMIATLL